MTEYKLFCGQLRSGFSVCQTIYKTSGVEMQARPPAVKQVHRRKNQKGPKDPTTEDGGT
jgi:hypothetical protein